MATSTLYRWLVLTFVAVAVVVGGTGVGWDAAAGGVRLVDGALQLAGGCVAAVVCWFTARDRSGPDRRWRLLMAAGTAGWTGGHAVASWSRTTAEPLATPGPAVVGYLLLPVCAFLALRAIASD